MNIEEREQLTLFLQQLVQAQATTKDGEAAALIEAACARQADAAYLLVQRAMLLEAAVHNSQAEITRLQGELARAKNRSPASQGGAGFIDTNAWGNSPTPVAPPASAPTPAASAAPPPAWGSGMLGTMATTAAGVVAGGFLFQGIGQLFGNQHSSSALAAGRDQTSSAALDQAAIVDPQDGADLFDTSSVDAYLASDTDA